MRPTISDQPGLIAIDKKRIWEVIDSPDQTHDIVATGLTLRLYAKREASHTDLVSTAKYEGRNIVHFAFRIYHDLRPDDISDLPPLDLLRAFLAKFGLDMAIGDKLQQLYLHERMPFTGTGFQIINPSTSDCPQKPKHLRAAASNHFSAHS